MALEGLDPEVVTQLAGQLKAQSQHIGGVVAHIDGIVNRIEQSWQGHTASEFAGWWRQQHRPALVGAQSAVDGLHQSALNNVTQQEQASGDIPSPGGRAGVSAGAGAVAAGAVAVAAGAGSSGGAPSSSPSQGSQFQSSVVATAEGQIGSTNQALYDSSTGERVGGAWCASFVTWTLEQNGFTTPPGGAASVQSWLTAAQNNQDGLSITNSPQPGDLVAYLYGQAPTGPFSAGHIGIMTSSLSGSGHFSAVSGNFDVNGVPQVASTNPGDAYGINGVEYSPYIPGWIRPVFIHLTK